MFVHQSSWVPYFTLNWFITHEVCDSVGIDCNVDTLTLQYGANAAAKILDSVLDGLSLDSSGALFVIDANAGVGNLFDAFVQKRATVNFNMHYVAVVSDQIQCDWFHETKATVKMSL